MAYKKIENNRKKRGEGSSRPGKAFKKDRFSSKGEESDDSEGKGFKAKPKSVKKMDKDSSKNKSHKPRTQTYNKVPKTVAKKTTDRVKKDSDEIRLNRFIASSGMCSRREADKYIELGIVKVNGKVITEMGYKVKSTDKVTFNDQTLRDQNKIYILLNKPKAYVTSTKDSKGERIVTDLVKGCCKERIFPVGNLDKNTSGVLILTNDGDLADELTHPKYNKKKIFHVWLDRNIKKADLERIVSGVELEDGFVAADAISFADSEDKTQVGIEIHSGKNNIVRRIFEHLDFKVKKLDRVYFAGLTKKGVQRGKWRFLNDREIAMLKMRSYK
jgi:23S rRNA pseudouridine2605 synthase